MTLTRRSFLSRSALGALGFALPVDAFAIKSATTRQCSLHPFVENHPEAVFIMRTNVDHKLNDRAKRDAGLSFGRSVFVPLGEGGFNPGTVFPVKLNLKTIDADKYPLEHILGTITDPFFSEGMFEAMKERGLAANRIKVRENDRGNSFAPYGLIDMANRTGVDFRTDLAGTIARELKPGDHFNWTEVPDGRWFRKIPHLDPINRPGTWLLNVSKFKTHGMGMTLSCKNLQGMVARPFTTFCARAKDDLGLSTEFRRDDALTLVQEGYRRHVAEGIIPRWDRPGDNGGSWQEAFSAKTLDNMSVTRTGINIIEDIYGRDGDCGNNGPHEPVANTKTDKFPGVTARDFMSNMIIFGKDPFRTDIIGNKLGGHEPGNFGFFHIAMERGLSDALDPSKIPVYLWENGTATLMPVDRFPKTPLLTYYLTRDYNGGTESNYHFCDEPFDYSKVHGIAGMPVPKKPEVIVHGAVMVTPTNTGIPVEYRLPSDADVKLEILDRRGRVVAVAAEGRRARGSHLAAWNTGNAQAGTYSYRLRATGVDIKGSIAFKRET